jgi:molecular chaperone DnaJ
MLPRFGPPFSGGPKHVLKNQSKRGRMEQPDCYAALGLSEDADAADVRRAYRRLARACHPDANPDDPRAAERFLTLAAAYAVLGHPARRAAYDGRRRYAKAVRNATPSPVAASPPAAFAPLDPRVLLPRRGKDLAAMLDIPDSLAASGGRLTLDFGVGGDCPVCDGKGALRQACWMCAGRGGIWQPLGGGLSAVGCPSCAGRGFVVATCPACAGSGRHDKPRQGVLVIAPHSRDGDRVRVAGAGQPGVGDGPPGDLLLTLRLFAVPEAEPAQGLAAWGGGPQTDQAQEPDRPGFLVYE